MVHHRGHSRRWGARAGYRLNRSLEFGLGGFYTGAKDAGADIAVAWAPLWTEEVVHPQIGLEVPVVFASQVSVAVAPFIGAEMTPGDLLLFAVQIPVTYFFAAPSQTQQFYLMGEADIGVRF